MYCTMYVSNKREFLVILKEQHILPLVVNILDFPFYQFYCIRFIRVHVYNFYYELLNHANY